MDAYNNFGLQKLTNKILTTKQGRFTMSTQDWAAWDEQMNGSYAEREYRKKEEEREANLREKISLFFKDELQKGNISKEMLIKIYDNFPDIIDLKLLI